MGFHLETSHFYTLLCSLPSQSVLPWAECPFNSNQTGPIEECERATPTQYFFYRETLNISSSIEENGGIHQGQALCLLLSWMMTYLFIIKGVKSTGKVRDLQVPQIANIGSIHNDRYSSLYMVGSSLQLTTHAVYICLSKCSHSIRLTVALNLVI